MRSWETTYGGETERVNLYTEGSDVLLLELAGKMALDEGGLYVVWSVRFVICKISRGPRISKRVPDRKAPKQIIEGKISYLSSSTVTDKHELEGGDGSCSFSHGGDLVLVGRLVKLSL